MKEILVILKTTNLLENRDDFFVKFCFRGMENSPDFGSRQRINNSCSWSDSQVAKIKFYHGACGCHSVMVRKFFYGFMACSDM